MNIIGEKRLSFAQKAIINMVLSRSNSQVLVYTDQALTPAGKKGLDEMSKDGFLEIIPILGTDRVTISVTSLGKYLIERL